MYVLAQNTGSRMSTYSTLIYELKRSFLTCILGKKYGRKGKYRNVSRANAVHSHAKPPADKYTSSDTKNALNHLQGFSTHIHLHI